MKTHGVHYAWIAAAVMGAVAAVAWLVEDQWLAFSAALLGLYVLHLVSVRYIVRAHADQLAALAGRDPSLVRPAAPTSEDTPDAEARVELEDSITEAVLDDRDEAAGEEASEVGEPVDVSETGPETSLREVAIPRHFMLGTVAIVRSVMEPEDVARVLMEQRQQPGKRFGELAVSMGLISDDQLDMLLEAQQRGLFTDAEIREARQRLESFRRAQAEPAART